MSKIDSSVREAVKQGVINAAMNPQTATTTADASIVASNVLTQVAPVVAHLTNSEPWYQSRVTLGAIIAAAAGLFGVFGYAFPAETQGKVIELIVALGPVIGGAIALYGRWVAKKPLGQ